MTSMCEHGAAADWWWDAMTGGGRHMAGWAGPLSRCGCCGSEFGFLEAATFAPGFGWGTRWQPRDRCAKCGGALVEWGEKPPKPPSGIGEMERRAHTNEEDPR